MAHAGAWPTLWLINTKKCLFKFYNTFFSVNNGFVNQIFRKALPLEPMQKHRLGKTGWKIRGFSRKQPIMYMNSAPETPEKTQRNI
jgi:hypothetical protein